VYISKANSKNEVACDMKYNTYLHTIFQKHNNSIRLRTGMLRYDTYNSSM